MKKYIIIIGIFLSLIIIVFVANAFRKDEVTNKEIADTVVSFFTSSSFDEELYNDTEKEALNTYLSTLTHENEEINISEFIVKNKIYETTEPNSSNIYKKDGECYIYYNELSFAFEEDEGNDNEIAHEDSGDAIDTLVCDGYKVDILEEYFNPSYEETKNDPKHSYVYMAMKTSGSVEKFYYASTYTNYYIEVNLYTKSSDVYNIEVKEVTLDEIPKEE